eukprot:CAMPEP_0181180424 /NCGR_PEP_ID=MMETSP1096-20121128/6791_1 /TAXON_ID=156174 ORGANISM="Chrysochromulina ericina, Strain CCMP281" /NCGR_SAMPLE_ID=MMETSP1096 /ASSEMBLY_ACC=CAM_ASM_000453 /LENGTH=87 /DNA_ID=CAMNT_0023268849 /DNA_START=384 /DNA_END=644 /DNA_ORIENTATION=+
MAARSSASSDTLSTPSKFARIRAGVVDLGMIAVGRCSPHASSTACGVVSCFRAIAPIVRSSVSGGDEWKDFMALAAPPMEECAVTTM